MSCINQIHPIHSVHEILQHNTAQHYRKITFRSFSFVSRLFYWTCLFQWTETLYRSRIRHVLVHQLTTAAIYSNVITYRLYSRTFSCALHSLYKTQPRAQIITYSITLALRAVTPKTCSLFREQLDTNRTFVTPTMTGSQRCRPPSKETELALLVHETLHRAKTAAMRAASCSCPALEEATLLP